MSDASAVEVGAQGGPHAHAGMAHSAGTAILNLMAVPLGVVGTAGVWQTMTDTQNASVWPERLLFIVGVLLWVALSARYLISGVKGGKGNFAADRENAFFGPFAGYIPVIGVLIASHYEASASDLGKAFVLVFVLALVVLDAQLLAHWLRGNFALATFHPGYFLPTVAGPFIATIGLGTSGWDEAAAASFGVGIFLWLVLGALLFSRLFTGPPLPGPLTPTLAILVSAPATGGIAWLVIARGQIGTFGYGILGILLLMVVVQVFFFAEYRLLHFMPSFWAFTFPVAAATNLTIRWLAIEQVPHLDYWSWALAVAASLFIAGIAAATVVDLVRSRRLGDTGT